MNNSIPIIKSEKVTQLDITKIHQSQEAQRIDPYLHDESFIVIGRADRIFFPKSTAEVSIILKEASKEKISVTISGAGTGLTGGRVPLSGWIIATDDLRKVDLSANEEILDWKDPDTKRMYTIGINNTKLPPIIRVPAGMPLKSVHQAAKKLGWFYAPDPTESSSFIGGNVGTNASGARTFKYGSTRNFVRGLKVVLSTGDVLKLNSTQKSPQKPHKWQIITESNQKKNIQLPSFKQPKVIKNAVGFPQYDRMPFQEIFIGTEGILGVITEVELHLIQAPKKILSIIAFYDSYDHSRSLVKLAQDRRDTHANLIPMSVEFVGKHSLEFMQQKTSQIPKNALSAIYIEQDVNSDKELDQALDLWLDLLDSTHSIDSWAEMDERGIEKHKTFRHALPETIHHFVQSRQVSVIGTDFCVPSENFDELFNYYLEIGDKFEKFLERKGTMPDGFPGYAMWGHIGDNHLHFNFLPRKADELRTAKKYYIELILKAIELNGTLTAEHGLGKKKYSEKTYLEYMIGQEGIKKLKMLKKQLDPAWILNLGNIF